MDKGFCMVCGKEILKEDIHTIPFSGTYGGLGSFEGIVHGLCAKSLQTEEEKEAFRKSEVVRLYNERCERDKPKVKKKGTREEWELQERKKREREMKRKFRKAMASGVSFGGSR